MPPVSNSSKHIALLWVFASFLSFDLQFTPHEVCQMMILDLFKLRLIVWVKVYKDLLMFLAHKTPLLLVYQLPLGCGIALKDLLFVAQILVEAKLWHPNFPIHNERPQGGFFLLPDALVHRCVITSDLISVIFSFGSFHQVIFVLYHAFPLWGLIFHRVIHISELFRDNVSERLVYRRLYIKVREFNLEYVKDLIGELIHNA